MNKGLELYDSKDRKGLEKYLKSDHATMTFLLIELILFFFCMVALCIIDTNKDVQNDNLLINIGKTYCANQNTNFYNVLQKKNWFTTEKLLVSCYYEQGSCYDEQGMKVYKLYEAK